MLDGNVTAFVAGGNLLIFGDLQSNAISVGPGGNYAVDPSDFVVKGYVSPTLQTTVNGQLSVEFSAATFNGVTRNVVITLPGPVTSQQTLAVGDLVAGHLFTFVVPGDLVITTGQGNDNVEVTAANVNGNVTITTLGGNDSVGMGKLTGAMFSGFVPAPFAGNTGQVQVLRNLTIASGTGGFITGDQVGLNQLQVGSTGYLNVIGSNLALLRIMDTSVGKSAVLTTGANITNATVELDSFWVLNSLTLVTGAGNDTVNIGQYLGTSLGGYGVKTNVLTVDTGTATSLIPGVGDTVTMGASTIGQSLVVRLGKAYGLAVDTLTLGNTLGNSVLGSTVLIGGFIGQHTLHTGTTNTYAIPPVIIGFQTITT
jgi:hypothetical protein